jgi:hypothetical protein
VLGHRHRRRDQAEDHHLRPGSLRAISFWEKRLTNGAASLDGPTVYERALPDEVLQSVYRVTWKYTSHSGDVNQDLVVAAQNGDSVTIAAVLKAQKPRGNANVTIIDFALAITEVIS